MKKTSAAVAALAVGVLGTSLGGASAEAVPAQPVRASQALTGKILVTINGNLFTIKLDGSGLRRLSTGGGIGDADVSPDGTKIAYHKGGRGRQDLYVMNADGPTSPG